MADFTQDKKYNYVWQSSKFKDLALSGSNISQFVNDAGYLTSTSSGPANTGSLLTTASFLDPNITFERGDKSSFNVNLSTLTIISASYALTASFINGGTF
jgi:hypothetical protein